MPKATRQGHCQICGQLNKLRGAVIVVHSYSGRWKGSSYCEGSKQLPYELSCDLIKQRISWLEDHIVELKVLEGKLSKPATIPCAWLKLHLVYSSRNDLKRDCWRKVDIIEQKHYMSAGDWVEFRAVYEDKYNKINQNIPTNKQKVLDVASELNARYCDTELHPNLLKAENYLTQLKERVANWKLTSLQPISTPKC